MAGDREAAAVAHQMLGDHPVALKVFDRVVATVQRFGPTVVRVSKSQIALRRRHRFAYLWRPRQYLGKGAEIVLTIALGRHDGSPRFKEVAHPSARHWLHHLEIDDPAAVDAQVTEWLREAFDRAG